MPFRVMRNGFLFSGCSQYSRASSGIPLSKEKGFPNLREVHAGISSTYERVLVCPDLLNYDNISVNLPKSAHRHHRPCLYPARNR